MDPAPEYIKETYTGSKKLLDKVALITGGDSAIGRAVSVHFAREGADIAIVYLDEDTDAKETKRLVEAEGRKCLLLKGDVKKSAFCKRAVANTVKQLGKLNILVNNAGMQFPQKDPKAIEEKQLEDTFRTNIFAYFHFANEALEYLNEGDCIINTTSVTAYRSSPNLIDYSSTKGAITSFTRSLATNLTDKKIRVNAVAPGPVWTPLIVATFDEEKIKSFGSETAMKRAGQPSERADQRSSKHQKQNNADYFHIMITILPHCCLNNAYESFCDYLLQPGGAVLCSCRHICRERAAV